MLNWISANKKWLFSGVGIIVVIGVFELIANHANALVTFLKIIIPIPLWLIIIIAILVYCVYLFFRLKRKQSFYSETLFYKQPRRITPDRKQSATPFSSKFLQSPQGSIAIWVYLQPFGEGIRKLVNNRHVVAHDTNQGFTKQIGDARKYVNVFSLSHGPKNTSAPDNPVWKIWLANGSGVSKTWLYEDSEELKPGWHHFLIRWDHGQPTLELLIDGNSVLKRDDYRQYWPEEYVDQVLLGTWTNRMELHFIDTLLWRAIPSFNFLDDAWLNRELALSRPQIR